MAMSEDLLNEIEAINSIYGPESLQELPNEETFILTIPDKDVRIRLRFPNTYPRDPPQAIGVESTGSDTRKGYGVKALDIAQTLLRELFVPGSVVIFSLVDELQSRSISTTDDTDQGGVTALDISNIQEQTLSTSVSPDQIVAPLWYLSNSITEKKSTFLGRAAFVESPVGAREALQHLLSTDKKAERATHNIYAFRIRESRNAAVTFQDCDDDGETAAGGLGPDRFRLINQVARGAVAEAHPPTTITVGTFDASYIGLRFLQADGSDAAPQILSKSNAAPSSYPGRDRQIESMREMAVIPIVCSARWRANQYIADARATSTEIYCLIVTT
ncbi:uncharacterized protein KY384_005353 [Bacidia gigantensis]|uniref:uncharacterized protein n=1 Tax=Bacidia gigantensis TaxID=2732470 RepID=UPI001D044257|nr:uncharacterized protein KY384_005353 [Bacidia gigantensis]KAG8529872.1 hypothetical protein KY384_005353 [Bacidia gigantensis]